MNQLREHGKEFNIYQLKPKLFTTQRDKNKLSVKEEDILKQVKLTFTQQVLSTLELSTLQDSQQEELIYKAVNSKQCQSQLSNMDIPLEEVMQLVEAMQLEELIHLDILEDIQMLDMQMEDIQQQSKDQQLLLMSQILIFTQSQSPLEELIYKEAKLMLKEELPMSVEEVESMFKDIE